MDGVPRYLGVGEDEEALGCQAIHDRLGDLVGVDGGGAHIVAGVEVEHGGADPHRAETGDRQAPGRRT